MHIGKLQGGDDIRPAGAAREGAIPAVKVARQPLGSPDVFSPSAESLSVSALVQRAKAQDQGSEARVAAAQARLRSGELDGKAVFLATARKMLEGGGDGLTPF
jgi:hypothetical protein